MENLLAKDIPTKYPSKEEWHDRFATNDSIPKYQPNQEIVGDYDKTLAIKCYNGTFVGKLDDDVASWKGIPFAKQPIGDLRWRKAQTVEASNKVFEAYNFGSTCLESIDDTERASQYHQGEDNLNLNIWTNIKNKSKKPVLVYIHGGGWVAGGTVDPLYNGHNFAHYNPEVIFITITYRLGLMGIINFDELPDGKDFKYSKNNAIYDQIEALKWIKQNIATFGGDPENITISGESAGGGSVSLLCVLDEAKGLFKKAIAMSGGVNQCQRMEGSTTLAKKLLEAFPQCKTVADLQKLSLKDLYKFWAVDFGLAYVDYPLMDGVTLPSDPLDEWKKGKSKDIIVLQGATTNEYAYWYPAFGHVKDMYLGTCKVLDKFVNKDQPSSDEYKQAYKQYVQALNEIGFKTQDEIIAEFANDCFLQLINYYQAEVHANNGGISYAYHFDQSYDGSYAELKAAHAVDCSYLFGNFDGDKVAGTKEQVDLSRRLQQMFVRFAISGNPSIDGFEWKPYTANERNRMIFRTKDMKLTNDYQVNRLKAGMKMMDSNENVKYIVPLGKIVAMTAEQYPEAYAKFMESVKQFNK